jgi:hypothetical protein
MPSSSSQERSPLLFSASRSQASTLYTEDTTGTSSPRLDSLKGADFEFGFQSEEEEGYDDGHPREIVLQDEETCLANTKETSSDATSIWTRIDPGAFQFAIRMAVMLTISSFLVLIKTDTWEYPDPMWVLVSVLFVSWFPSLDAASVIEKITQRLIGTFVGAVLGLGCGFTSLLFHDHSAQVTFMILCMFVFNFGIIFIAGQCKVGDARVIKRYAYATILCVLTYCICMLPFALEADPKYELGVNRVCNVVVGCFMGAVGAITVCPKSTTAVLHEKTARQVKLAGEASEAVLHTAASFFSGKVEVGRLADELMMGYPLTTTGRWSLNRLNSGLTSVSEDSSSAINKTDVALLKYEEAIADWKVSKSLFPLAAMDPFFLSWREDDAHGRAARVFHKEIARTLARALRIQTTIVVLDGMVRNDAEFEFGQNELHLFEETGTLIRRVLTVPLEPKKSDAAAIELFDNLEQTRSRILTMSTAVSKSEDEASKRVREWEMTKFKRSLMSQVNDDFLRSDDEMGRGIPKFASSCNDNSLFFLQLVEHLILRSLRLYQVWKHVEQQAMSVPEGAHHKILVV